MTALPVDVRPAQWETIVHYLDLLWPDAEAADGWLSLFSACPNGAGRVDWAQLGDVRRLAIRAAAADGHNVWLGLASRQQRLADGKRGGGKDCLLVPAFWLDVDCAHGVHAAENLPTMEQALDIVHGFPLPPTFMVDTGGGLHVYWCLAEPITVEEYSLIRADWQYTWTQRFRGYQLDDVFDVARVLRVPGTRNCKFDDPPEVAIVEEQGRRWGLDDIGQYLQSAPVVERPAPASTSAYTGPKWIQATFDDFNHRHGAVPDVFGDLVTLVREDGEASYWHYVRATNDISLSHGATPAGDRVYVFSDTLCADYGFRKGSSYTLAACQMHLERLDSENQSDRREFAAGLNDDGYGEIPRPGGLRARAGENLTPAPVAAVDDAASDPLLGLLNDWTEVFAADRSSEDWLVEPFIPAGRGVALYAVAKTGKSLLALDIAAAAATGRGFSGGAVEPIDVLYLDYEMTFGDLLDRATDMGLGPDDLGRLHYATLPALPPLDTEAGGNAVLRLAQLTGSKLVVIDTLCRTFDGDENDAKVVQAFAKHTGLRLKQEGIAFLRIDHAGKDLDRGQRGSSAKVDDVDLVWQLSAQDRESFQLKRTHSRVNWVPERVNLRREVDPVLRHVIADETFPPGTEQLVLRLVASGVCADNTVREALAALKKHSPDGKGAKQTLVAAALRKLRVDREENTRTFMQRRAEKQAALLASLPQVRSFDDERSD